MVKPTLLLSELCRDLGRCLRDAEVVDLVTDSRAASLGCLFVAVPGHKQHGSAFIQDAIDRGASAVLTQHDIDLPDRIGLVIVDDVRAVLGIIAARLFATARHDQHLLAVTGTNGKTSTVQLIAQLLTHLNCKAGTVGTLGFQLPSGERPTRNTTPDVVEIHRYLADAASEAVSWVALEASSHGLAQQRLAGLQIGTAAITNITQDHLDYHGSMADYIAAKAQIIELPSLNTLVMDLDDPEVRRLRAGVPAHIRVLGFSLVHGRDADVVVKPRYHALGTEARLQLDEQDLVLQLPLVGEFYLRNTLTALLMLWAEGFALEDLIRAASRLEGVPGRLERVEPESDVAVYVDYAHTPDAIARVLQVLRPTVANDLWVVFGCGGDRDASKRPLMGQAALSGADWVVLTSDNPRSEDPVQILNDIQKGCPNPRLVLADRAKAIEMAIVTAAAGDTLVIAGKGHETEQVIGDVAYPFSDVATAKAALSLRKCA